MDDYNVEFYAGFGSLVEKLHPPGQSILLFRPGPKHFQENDTLYEGNLRDIEGLKKWFMEVSKYFIREVSYVNAEEIMEEKKTLLILFRVKAKHADYETLYVNVIRNELMGKKGNISLLLLFFEKNKPDKITVIFKNVTFFRSTELFGSRRKRLSARLIPFR